MGAKDRPLTAEQRRQRDASLEDLIWGLFGQNNVPFFDKSSFSPTLVEEFVRSEEALEAAEQFATQLLQLWRLRYPGKSLRLRPRGNLSDTVERHVLPDFSDKSAPERPNKGQDAKPVPNADAEGKSEMPTTDQGHSPVPATADSSASSQSDSAPGPSPDTKPESRPGDIPSTGTPDPRPPDPRASFSLPNAKVGVAYAETPQGRTPEGIQVRLVDVRLPEGLGLGFDPDRGEVSGTPAHEGDYRIPLRWTLDGKETYSGDCLLIVNPDPQSLWKVLEPPADAPYRKDHIDSRLIQGDDYQILAASRRGRSHEHAGSFRDDDFHIARDPDSGWDLILVADGAGSAPFSREGSRLAVSAAGDHLSASLAGEMGTRVDEALAGWAEDPQETARAIGTEFHYLFHKAAQLAVQSIEREAETRGAAPRDYATTLLAAAIRRLDGEIFLASFWMGDGAIAAYGPRGRVRLMGTPDGGEFAGQTRFLDRASISDQGFAKRIGIGRFADLNAVLLMTDGVSDPRFETDNGLSDPVRWDALWDDLIPLLESPDPERRIAEWLGFFSPGHHDDRTIALLW